MENLVRISKLQSVNPKHVISVVSLEKELQTVIILLGGFKAESDYTFKETIDLLNGKEVQRSE